MSEKVLVEKADGVAVVTLHKPEGLNSLDLQMREDLKDALLEIGKDPEIGAVILAGSGRAFCAGGDIGTMGDFLPNDGRKRLKNIHMVVKAIVEMDKPVIAAVQGYATGAGMNLALACDLIVAADDARFCQSFTKIGLVPDCGGMYFLPRKVGMARAKELVLLAPTIDAQTALAMGIVNKVVPFDQLMTEVKAIAAKFAHGPKIAFGLAKAALNTSFETDLYAALDTEAYAQDLLMQSQDFKEGVAAFKEKRKPIFQGK
jgi:2-(1,2-epoxy-1,2-dihydrophenyl)acetyl-CoA isomerase